MNAVADNAHISATIKRRQRSHFFGRLFIYGGLVLLAAFSYCHCLILLTPTLGDWRGVKLAFR